MDKFCVYIIDMSVELVASLIFQSQAEQVSNGGSTGCILQDSLTFPTDGAGTKRSQYIPTSTKRLEWVFL